MYVCSGTSLKGHSKLRTPLYKGHTLWSLQDHGNTIYLLKYNLSITVKLAGPKVSISLYRFMCIASYRKLY